MAPGKPPHETQTSTSTGPWMICSPDELVATFLVQLPDHLPLPDRAQFPMYTDLDDSEAEQVATHLDRLHGSQLLGEEIVTLSDIVPIPNGMDFSQLCTLQVSVQLHQVKRVDPVIAETEPAMRVAHLVARETPATSVERESALAAPATLNTELPDDAPRQIVTVAECVVPLRIISPMLSTVGHVLPEAAPADEGNQSQMWDWRFYEQAPDEVVEDRLRGALDRSIEAIRTLQRTYHAWKRVPLRLATKETLPFAIPTVIRRWRDIGMSDSTAIKSLVVTRIGPDMLSNTAPPTDEELHRFHQALRRPAGEPLSTHLDLHREACVALDRDGNPRLSALLAGMAAETALDELLLHLLWEEAATPEEAAALPAWNQDLQARVPREFAPRLHGSWDLKGQNRPGDWSRDVAGLRNRIVHSGYVPTRAEAERALNAQDMLVTYLCDRLADRSVRRKYPRTAAVFCGDEGLTRRNALDTEITRLLESADEPDWLSTFARWKESWRRLRRDLRNGVRSPETQGSALLLVMTSTNEEVWVLHERNLHMAIPASPPAPAEVVKQVEAARSQVAKARAAGVSGDVSCELLGIAAEAAAGAEWLEEYHLVPMTEVMIDGSDRWRRGDVPRQP